MKLSRSLLMRVSLRSASAIPSRMSMRTFTCAHPTRGAIWNGMAWVEMEGAGCVCHREQNCLGKALAVDGIQDIIKKIKGTCAHFHRSDKVLPHMFYII